MGKLTPVQVSFRDFVMRLLDDWVISYHVYMKT